MFWQLLNVLAQKKQLEWSIDADAVTIFTMYTSLDDNLQIYKMILEKHVFVKKSPFLSIWEKKQIRSELENGSLDFWASELFCLMKRFFRGSQNDTRTVINNRWSL